MHRTRNNPAYVNVARMLRARQLLLPSGHFPAGDIIPCPCGQNRASQTVSVSSPNMNRDSRQVCRVLWQALQYNTAFSILFPRYFPPFVRLSAQNRVPVSFRPEPYRTASPPSPYLS